MEQEQVTKILKRIIKEDSGEVDRKETDDNVKDVQRCPIKEEKIHEKEQDIFAFCLF